MTAPSSGRGGHPRPGRRPAGTLTALRRRVRRLRARSRLRAANLRRTGAAMQRQRPPTTAEAAPATTEAAPGATAAAAAAGSSGVETTDVQTTYGAPRTLLYVTVKRDNPTWRDLYGHWWLEVGECSYGWWPRAVPVGLRQLLTGTDGVLNGIGLLGRRGTWNRDAQHGRPAAHTFHPVLIEALTDQQVRQRLRTYAHSYQGHWRWAWTAGTEHDTCRSFQDGLLRAAALTEGLEHLASRGQGCLLLYRPRTALWWLQDRLDQRRDRSAERSLSPRCPF